MEWKEITVCFGEVICGSGSTIRRLIYNRRWYGFGTLKTGEDVYKDTMGFFPMVGGGEEYERKCKKELVCTLGDYAIERDGYIVKPTEEEMVEIESIVREILED